MTKERLQEEKFDYNRTVTGEVILIKERILMREPTMIKGRLILTKDKLQEEECDKRFMVREVMMTVIREVILIKEKILMRELMMIKGRLLEAQCENRILINEVILNKEMILMREPVLIMGRLQEKQIWEVILTVEILSQPYVLGKV